MKAFQEMSAKFAAYAPHFTGPITPQESVGHMLKVFARSSVDSADAGTMVSHFGNKQWL